MTGPAAGRVPVIHVLNPEKKDVGGRDKPGHDDVGLLSVYASTVQIL